MGPWIENLMKISSGVLKHFSSWGTFAHMKLEIQAFFFKSPRGQNIGQSINNVWPEWCLGQPKAPYELLVMLTGHPAIFEKTAKTSTVNLRFCLLVKIQSRLIINKVTQ